MQVEEPVMKDGRTSTGIIHGTLSNDSSMVTWFHFIEKTSQIGGQVVYFVKLTHEGPKRFARISKIIARQTRNVYPWVFVC